MTAPQIGAAALATPTPGAGATTTLRIVAAERDGATVTLVYLRDDCHTLAAVDTTSVHGALSVTLRARMTPPRHVSTGDCHAAQFLEAVRRNVTSATTGRPITDGSTGQAPPVILRPGSIQPG